MKTYVCMDIGSTAIKHSRMREDACILSKGETPTEAMQGGAHIMERVKQVIREYIAQDPEIAGICLSTSGMVYVEDGSIQYAYEGQMPDYTGMPVKKIMEETFGLPCEVENDVKCAALGEYYQGAGVGSRSCFMITVGTGIGGCYIENGEILRGASGSAGEVGYMKVRGASFQENAAASVLTSRVAEAKGLQQITGYEVFQKAKEGDAVCIAEIDRLISYLAEGLAIIGYTVNPELLVLGGGIMAQEAYLRPRLEAALQKEMLPVLYESTTLAFAKTKNDAGMIGALYHFLGMQGKRLTVNKEV